MVYPSNLKRNVLMRYRNSSGKLIEIYDTDESFAVDKIYDNYNVNNDLQMMLKTIEKTQGTKKRSIDEFIENLYESDRICKYQKVDQSF